MLIVSEKYKYFCPRQNPKTHLQILHILQCHYLSVCLLTQDEPKHLCSERIAGCLRLLWHEWKVVIFSVNNSIFKLRLLNFFSHIFSKSTQHSRLVHNWKLLWCVHSDFVQFTTRSIGNAPSDENLQQDFCRNQNFVWRY